MLSRMAAEPKLVLTDDDFLAVVADEFRQSIGFETLGEGSTELALNREKSLEYIKGEMTDMPSLPNRSTAVSTDVSDAIETVLPDIMEVFTGGEDVATFRPQGEEDVDAAAQETDYVNHVFFNDNRGWLALYTKFKDALSTKIGVVKVWGEKYEETEEEHFTGQTQMAVQMAAESGQGEIEDLIAGEPEPMTGEPLWNFTLRRTRQMGKACVKAVPPEDFGIAKDTVVIADTTYCVMRSRPRAQELIADGYDPDDVGSLSPYGSAATESVEQARDTAGEHNSGIAQSSTDFNLHQVEIREHYIRVDADGDGTPELWCVVTGEDEAVLLKKERVDRIPFAVSTPFLVTHRLFGRSLFDLLGEVQKIKTALLRLMLDSGYFALNQRYEVAMAKGSASQFTLSDLLNNIPGAPVRSENGNAVRAIGGGRLDFDVAGALEYVSTMAEQRAGVVRNAQGLNPDSLHDTKGGMEKLFNAAQKRVRMICRVFAETGVKDMFLLLHDVLRTTQSQGATVRLRNKWVQIDPTSWGSRSDMTIHVGVGSGGREMELAGLQMVIAAQKEFVQLQGGTEGPHVTAANLYNSAKRLAELTGAKDPGKYFSEPPVEDPNAPKEPPPPDPEMVKAQQEDALKRYEIDRKTEVELRKLELEDELARERGTWEIKLKREQMGLEARLAAFGADSGGSPVRFGGEVG